MGGWGVRDGSWVATQAARPFRNENGELLDREILLLRWVPNMPAWKLARSEAPKVGDVLEIEVERTPVRGVDRALTAFEYALVGWRPVEDQELRDFAAANAPPTQVVVPGLGLFSYDPRAQWYEAVLEDPPCKFAVTPLDRVNPTESFERAKQVITGFLPLFPAILEGVARSQYANWAKNWADESLSWAEWTARLKLESITWFAENPVDDYTVWLGDGGLFSGHSIEVWVKDGAVKSANLAG